MCEYEEIGRNDGPAENNINFLRLFFIFFSNNKILQFTLFVKCLLTGRRRCSNFKNVKKKLTLDRHADKQERTVYFEYDGGNNILFLYRAIVLHSNVCTLVFVNYSFIAANELIKASDEEK